MVGFVPGSGDGGRLLSEGIERLLSNGEAFGDFVPFGGLQSTTSRFFSTLAETISLFDSSSFTVADAEFFTDSVTVVVVETEYSCSDMIGGGATSRLMSCRLLLLILLLLSLFTAMVDGYNGTQNRKSITRNTRNIVFLSLQN